jgi:hypothetical protein
VMGIKLVQIFTEFGAVPVKKLNVSDVQGWGFQFYFTQISIK